jgi:hypothetical protein
VAYDELGGDYFERRHAAAGTRRHVNALRRLGHEVSITTSSLNGPGIGLRPSGAAAPHPALAHALDFHVGRRPGGSS